MSTVRLRHVTREDLPMIGRWLAAPHVWRWWHQEHTPAALERDFGPVLRGEDPAEDFVAVVDDRPVGLLQRSVWRDDPDDLAALSRWTDVPDGAVTIDYLVADGVGLGLGPLVIGALVEDTWRTFPDCPAIIVPVVAGNRPSWRALEKVGFVRVAEAELPPDNPVDPPGHVVMRLDRSPS